MFLIDKPFVSDYLIHTIKANKYPIIATKVAKELINDNSLAWIHEDKAISLLKNNSQISVYSNSENALSWIEQNLGESILSTKIKTLKDKFKFRELIKELFPDFHFKKVRIEDIPKLSAKDITFPFVIKPSVGFFSIGVHIVKNEEDWVNAKNELHTEKLTSIFPENVLNTSHFIIEEFIEGEEYAIDFFYDNNGNAILLNVLHHLFSSATDTSDRVYTTSKAIIEKHKPALEYFLNSIGERINLINFPAHMEVRIDTKGKIVPIEINPLRFGGWCTTGDLLGVTLGFNSYKCFYENRTPDWKKIFEGKETKKFSVVILDNNSKIEPGNIVEFKYSDLERDFENAVELRKIDIHNYPVFGFVFTETSVSNEKELQDILRSDLKKYIIARE